jgi:hypothetical protein
VKDVLYSRICRRMFLCTSSVAGAADARACLDVR